MDKLVVGVLLQEDEAEQAAADDRHPWQEEAAGVLQARVADPFSRAV